MFARAIIGTTLFVLWSGPWTGLAVAAPAQPEDFDALIHRGVQLRRQGDDRKAEDFLHRAYALSPTPRAAAQLGLVEFALGEFDEAERHLTEALAANEPWIELHRSVLQQSRQDVRRNLVRVDIVGAANGSTIVLGNGRSLVLPADATIWLAPGPTSLSIESPNRDSLRRSIDGAAGEHVAIDLSPAPALAAISGANIAAVATSAPTAAIRASSPTVGPTVEVTPQTSGTPTSSSGGAHAALAWTALGGGVALLGIGIGAAYIRERTVGQIRALNDPEGAPRCFVRGDQAEGPARSAPASDCVFYVERFQTARTISTVGFVGAGILTAAGVVLFLTQPEKSSGRSRSTAAAACTYSMMDRSPAVACQLRF